MTVAAMACSLVALSACKKERQVAVVQKPRVTVVAATEQKYVERFDFPARIDAVNNVTLKTRVAGFLKERLFEEGDVVKKNQLLFTIEKEPFEAKVAQAAADLKRAEADAKNARLSLERALELIKSGNISQATVDAREADNAMAQAAVLQAKATLNLAKIDLSYTNVRAPFTGKIGLADFSDGEFLPANTTLASMVSTDPMYVVFSVSERELLSMQSAGVFRHNGDNLAVTMQMADDSVYRFGGQINFFDVTVDNGTDTVKLRAAFPNPKQELIAGQYVTVVLEYESPSEKVVIPMAAVMSSAAMKYVYVVDNSNKVVNRPVVLGPQQGSEIVVTDGLNRGDRIIVEGLQKVRAGQEVVAETKSAFAPAPAPAVEKKASEKVAAPAAPATPAAKKTPEKAAAPAAPATPAAKKSSEKVAASATLAVPAAPAVPATEVKKVPEKVAVPATPAKKSK